MRKQLSQPSFINGFARSKGESARPDLWFEHMWMPSLGNQGALIRDISGSKNMVHSGGWNVDSCSFDGSVANIVASDASIGMAAGYLVGTIAIDIQLSNATDTAKGILSFGNTALDGQTTLMIAQNTSTIRVYCATGGTHGYNTLTSTAVAGGRYKIVLSRTPGGPIEHHINGIQVLTTANPTAARNYANMYIASGFNGLFTGSVYSVMASPRYYTPRQITELYSDPVLPFRRKPFVSFYVPSSSPTFKPYYYRHKPQLLGAG